MCRQLKGAEIIEENEFEWEKEIRKFLSSKKEGNFKYLNTYFSCKNEKMTTKLMDKTVSFKNEREYGIAQLNNNSSKSLVQTQPN